MKSELKQHLQRLAELLELQHVEGNQYKGKSGTIFIMTPFGFLTETQYRRTKPKEA